jgi:7-cyano-7-deazaguanine synthase
MPKAIVLLSGGLDSATVATRVIAEGHDVIALSFHYGQRNLRELHSAKSVVQKLGIKEHIIAEVNFALWSPSLLIAQLPGMRQPGSVSTGESYYLPGRNTVFIAIALSVAEAKKAQFVYLGFTAADVHYPDTNQHYIEAFEPLIARTFPTGLAPRLVAPLVKEDKAGIIRQALRLHVPIEETWSCYADGDEPCGLCNACRMRDFALIQEGRADLATDRGRSLYAAETRKTTQAFWRYMLR